MVQRVRKPVYVINSNRTAHPEKLNYLAFATGARYIDLTRNEVEQLAREMMQIPYRLIEVKVLSGQVSDIYPKAKAVVTQRHFTRDQVKIGVEAPKHVKVFREEVFQAIQKIGRAHV